MKGKSYYLQEYNFYPFCFKEKVELLTDRWIVVVVVQEL